MIKEFVHSSLLAAAIFIAKQLLVPLTREHGPLLLSKTWRRLKRFFGPCFPTCTVLPTTGQTTNSTANTSNAIWFTFRAASSRLYRIYAAAVDSNNSDPVPEEVTSLEEIPLASPAIDLEAGDLSV